jgi:mannosylglucosylglycerate synthase
MKIAILHYSAPPEIGGVEQTIYYHASHLAAAGHEVRIVAGAGTPWDQKIDVQLIAEAGSRHPAVLALQEELARSGRSPVFAVLRDLLHARLAGALAGFDALMVHNVCTLHKNLALTAALRAYLDEPGPRPRALGWHHDLAWTNAQYLPQLHDGYPWDLLRIPWPGVRHVTVSEARRAEVAALFGLAPCAVAVVPPGVDPALFYRWDPLTVDLVERFGLLSADVIFLLPARITRRKNIELALRILAAFRALTCCDARLLVTGPPGPHNPGNAAYLDSLRWLRAKLDLENSAYFLHDTHGAIPDSTMPDLYLLADALLFPSTQEGFGIPILEAGLARLPIFCSDILPLRETGGGDAHYFDPNEDPRSIAESIAALLNVDPAYQLRRRVLAGGTWSGIVAERVLPLLHERNPGP